MNKTLFEIMSGMKPVMWIVGNIYYLILVSLFILTLINSGLSAAVIGAVMALSFSMPVFLWMKKGAYGLPFIFVYCCMNTVWYFFPLAFRNESIQGYSNIALLESSIELFLHFSVLIISYSVLNVRVFVRRPKKLRVLQFMESDNKSNNIYILFSLFVGAVVFEWLRVRTSLISQFVPGSFNNVLYTFVAFVTSVTALFLTFHLTKIKNQVLWWAFWTFWCLFIAVQASGLILAGTIGFLLSTLIGIFLGRRRIPWLFLIIASMLVATLNQGKFDMREKYWAEGTEAKPGLVALYSEWFEASYKKFTTENEHGYRRHVHEDGQSLLSDRLSNLQMLLYVQKKVAVDGLPLLMGKTYLYGPQLLIPRFLWPDKPIAHMSQIELNLHFERQHFNSIEDRSAYIAWGLVPEAYGNFGPYLGSLVSGVFMGLIFRILAVFALSFPLNSVRAILALVLLAMSFSWVTLESSVLVTSTVQMVIMIIGLGLIYGRKKRNPMYHAPRTRQAILPERRMGPATGSKRPDL